MDSSRLLQISAALETISRERLDTDRELIRLGALEGAEAHLAGILTGHLYAARDLVLMHDQLVTLLERTRPFLPAALAARVDVLLERAHKL